MHERANTKYEIESEFSKTMARHFKRLLSKNSTKEVQVEVESAFEEMFMSGQPEKASETY